MRIVHVVPELLPCPPVLGGGLEKLAAGWARGLAARGHDVHVVTPAAPLWPHTPMQWEGVTVHPISDRRYRSHVVTVVTDLDPEVVHLHNRPSWAPELPGPVVVSLHNPPAAWRAHGEGETAAARGLASVAMALPVSEWLAGTLDPRVAREVITGHVDDDVFRPGIAARQPRTLLFAGKLDPKKGLEVALDALDHLGGWRLTLSCPMPPVPGFERWQADVLARAAGDRRVSVLVPTVHDAVMGARYASAAVVVVPTVGEEALGLVSLEAQACGTPVVVSDRGGLPETVEDGVTGVVVEAGDAEALAEGVWRVDALRGDVSSFVRHRFALGDRLDRLERVYRRVSEAAD